MTATPRIRTHARRAALALLAAGVALPALAHPGAGQPHAHASDALGIAAAAAMAMGGGASLVMAGRWFSRAAGNRRGRLLLAGAVLAAAGMLVLAA